jgi:hypothetical protein
MAKRDEDPDELVRIITKGKLTRDDIIEYAELTMGKDFIDFICGIDFTKEEPITLMKLLLKNFLKIGEKIVEINRRIIMREKFHLIKANIDEIKIRLDRISYIYTGFVHTHMEKLNIPTIDLFESIIDANAEIVYSAYFNIEYQVRDTELLKACNYARLIYGKGDEKYAVDLFRRIVHVRDLIKTLNNELKNTRKKSLEALAKLCTS